ncbi:hypothetical protein Prudu_465S000400 [Prunus dulcis]|uniref:Uncharacterized protein n=1 Tax=Prunus dulcis TaxID=3755 RepID=A0A5H2XK22_PRUDU|nr:hypothetical protein Prudu_465S000400 [Prunus dulcis]
MKMWNSIRRNAIFSNDLVRYWLFPKVEQSQNFCFILPSILDILFFKKAIAAETNLWLSNVELHRYSRIHVFGSNCTAEAPQFFCTQEVFAFRIT